MTRQRNPRVLLLNCLDDVHQRLKWVRDIWRHEGRTTVFVEHSTDRRNPWRKREPHEYPENQVKRWDEVIGQMTIIERDAMTIREFAQRQRNLLINPVSLDNSEE